jgi:hypothetical protein
MKNILIAILFLATMLGTVSTQSQSKPVSKKLSLTVQGGAFIPLGDAAGVYKTGGNFGLGVNYKVRSNIELYAEGNYNFLSLKTGTGFDGSPSIIDIKAGGRFSFGTGKYRTFVEGGAGIYMFKTPGYTYTTYVPHIHIDPKTQDTTYTYDPVNTTAESQTTSKFGIHAGIGEVINIAKNVDLFLKSDYNMVFTSGSSTTFFGIHAGAKFGI